MKRTPFENECAMPWCEKVRANGMTLPICAKHARQVYTEARGLIELASRIYPPEVAAPPSKTGRAMRNALDQPGKVYFMLMPGGAIKVGFSTRVRERAKTLGAIEVLATFAGTRRDEKAMHARLGPHWIEGELFEDCPEVRQAIAEVAA